LKLAEAGKIFLGNLGTVVGMNADGAAHIGERAAKLESFDRVVDIGADGDHPFNPG